MGDPRFGAINNVIIAIGNRARGERRGIGSRLRFT